MCGSADEKQTKENQLLPARDPPQQQQAKPDRKEDPEERVFRNLRQQQGMNVVAGLGRQHAFSVNLKERIEGCAP
jgi:hypothetical protein